MEGISDRSSPEWALLPLRAFLGITFVFAGLQKLADPLFLRRSAPASIQSQLRNAAHSSPVGGILAALGHHAVAVGLLIALAELAVGAGMLLGLFSRVAAAGGVLLSLGFLLSVSWHDHPYYLGPDIFSLFAFTPFVALGAGQLSVDAWLEREVRAAAPPRTPGPVLDRRAFLRRAGFAGAAAGVGLVAASMTAAAGRVLGGSRGGNEAAALPTSPPRTTAHAPATTTPPATAPGAPSAAPSAAPAATGTPIAHVSQLPVGRGGTFRDPASGEQAWLVRPAEDRFVAFDARCTHQGCPVEYDGRGLFVCPCHGAEFDASTGQAVRGPADQPLTPITVHIGPDQRIYVDG